MCSQSRPTAEDQQGLPSRGRWRGPDALGGRAGGGAGSWAASPQGPRPQGDPGPGAGSGTYAPPPRQCALGAVGPARPARPGSTWRADPSRPPSPSPRPAFDLRGPEAGSGAAQLRQEAGLRPHPSFPHRTPPEAAEEGWAARSRLIGPISQLHKAAPLSPQGITAAAGPARLLPRAGAHLPPLPAWVLLVLASGEALTHPNAGLWDLHSPRWFPTAFPITETPWEMPLALFYR